MLNLGLLDSTGRDHARALRQVREEQAADARRVSATLPAQEGIAVRCLPRRQI